MLPLGTTLSPATTAAEGVATIAPADDYAGAIRLMRDEMARIQRRYERDTHVSPVRASDRRRIHGRLHGVIRALTEIVDLLSDQRGTPPPAMPATGRTYQQRTFFDDLDTGEGHHASA